MKRYLKLSIIRKLPLFVVLSVLFLAAAFFSTAEVSFERSYYGYSYIQMLDTSCTSSLLAFFFITMMVLPLFNMNYRYSLAKSDLYRQVGFKNNSIRIGEHLSTLITVCISFTFSFAVLVSILLFKNQQGSWLIIGIQSYILPPYQWALANSSYHIYLFRVVIHLLTQRSCCSQANSS